MSAQHASPGDPSLVEVAEGIHAWVQPDGTWWVNNTGAVSGADGTVVIDTCATDVRTRRFIAALTQQVPGSSLRMAVNTHQHGDHTYGNSILPPETVIVGHEKMREGLRVDPIIDGCPPVFAPLPDWGEITRRLPSITFADTATLYAGERRIELAHPGLCAPHLVGDEPGLARHHQQRPEGQEQAQSVVRRANPAPVVAAHGCPP